MEQARVLVKQIVIGLAKGSLLLVLGHELVLAHLSQRVERFIVLVCQAAIALLFAVDDLNFQPAGSFTEILVVWRLIVARRELIGRVDDAFEV